MIYKDRRDAGQKLVPLLEKFKNNKDTIVIALPRGGVIIADEIASNLNLSLDIVVPRKVGSPFSEEFAIGAISEQGEPILHNDVIAGYGIGEEYISETIERELKESNRRQTLYRQGKSPLNLAGKTVIIVDDGVATGATMMAGITSVKEKGPETVIVAVPFLPPEALSKFQKEVSEVIYLEVPEYLGAVGEFYERFDQVSDSEVIDILEKYCGNN